MTSQKIVIANWKMKLSLADTLSLAKKMKQKFQNFKSGTVALCPNFISMIQVKEILKNSPIKLGAQDVFWEDIGPYTGEISASMLKEAGCDYVIIGHSERREYLLVNYEMIHKTLRAVLNVSGLIPIVCIGENLKERKTNRRDFVLVEQLNQALTGINIVGKEQIIIAYEPIWAIGSGIVIEPAEAEYAHKIIRLTLNNLFGAQVVSKNFKIIYGGSIDKHNAKGFVKLENMDGLLVGGASLNAEEFYQVARVILK